MPNNIILKIVHEYCYGVYTLSYLILLCFRAINYDERDPFLCNSCGYSKYAKFETTVSGKSCAAVDPIENEEDRKKVL